VEAPRGEISNAIFLHRILELKVNTLTQENLHRTAKYFMDTGRAKSANDAVAILKRFGLYIVAGAEVADSRDHQIALLSLVNMARRTFLGGVHVIGAPVSPLLVGLAHSKTVYGAVSELGGTNTKDTTSKWPVALIGSGNTDAVAPSWRVTWQGWRGGVVPLKNGRRLQETSSIGITPALAAAVCAAEVFLYHSDDHPMAGHRDAGISLWNPTVSWLGPDLTEPELSYLPDRLWLVGLGNLGQAYLWHLACLPYRNNASLNLVLQDFDQIAKSNDSTSLLTNSSMFGQMKTRAVATWLEDKGFRVTLEERRFGDWTRRAPMEPPVALFGVDNALARASLERAGFELIVETGLGAGPQAFLNFSLHTFPSSLVAAQLWSSTDTFRSTTNLLNMPAYEPSKHPELDECGLAQLASRTVGVPFVGLTAGAFAIAELLRRLHGGLAIELVSASMSALEDVEVSFLEKRIYEFGHVALAA
jgi:hypothetical protein